MESMIRASWQGGLAILFVWGICRLWPKLPAHLRAWLWRLAYLKLFMALFWTTPIDIPLLPAQPRSQPANASVVLPAATLPYPDVNLAQHTEATGFLEPELVYNPTPIMKATVLPTWRTWLCLLWCIGVVFLIGRRVRDWKRTAAMRRRATPVQDPDLVKCLADTCRLFGIRRSPSLFWLTETSSPFLSGLLHPWLVLPGSLRTSTFSVQFRLLLAHELAHLKRYDLWWNWLAMAGQGVFFFHPLVWIAQKEWQAAQEMACDELAVSITQSPAAEYGRMLVDIAQASLFETQAGDNLISARVIGSKQSLKRRLSAMKTMHSVSSLRLVLLSGIVLLTGTIGLLPWRLVAQSPEAEPDRVVEEQISEPVEAGAEDIFDAVEAGEPEPVYRDEVRDNPLSADKDRPPSEVRDDVMMVPDRPVEVYQKPSIYGNTRPNNQLLNSARLQSAERSLKVLEAQLEAARAEMALVEKKLERSEALKRENSISQAEVDRLQAEFARARANVILVESQIEMAVNVERSKDAEILKLRNEINRLKEALAAAQHEKTQRSDARSIYRTNIGPSVGDPSIVISDAPFYKDLVASLSATSEAVTRQKELLHQELDLAEQQLKIEEEHYKAGRTDLESVIRVRREMYSLRRMLARLDRNPREEQKILQEEIKQVEAQLQYAKQRQEAGLGTYSDTLKLRRELLALERALAVLEVRGRNAELENRSLR
jgi:beta-lactamase regulating signal transducer with metallopeptidase domain/multidrug resistance efflux pump